MQSLARNGYTAAEVDKVLHAENRTLDFRYDLLDSANKYKAPLSNILSGSVANNALANIKRTARFAMLDDGSINFLSDRIKPYARLKMPDITRYTDNYNLSFDGVNDRVQIANSATLRPTTITIEATIMASDLPSWMGIMTCKTGANDGINLQFGTEQKIAALIGDGSSSAYIKTSWTPVIGTRYTVSIVHDSADNSNNLYVNGVLEATLNKALSYNANAWQIGTFYTNSLFWKGNIDEVRIWNVARTQAEIQSTMNTQLAGNESGLVGYWKLNEGTGLTAYDSTANGNNGTITGATWVKEGLNKTVIPSSFVEFPLGVFILSTPPRRSDITGNVTREVEAYDLLQVLVDDKVSDRHTVAAGANYITAIKSLLDGGGITTQNLTATTSTLPAARDWAPGTTKLKIINDLLGAINYRSLFFDENGTAVAIPYQSPAARASEYTYVDDSSSVIFPEVEQSLDLFGIPNKWTLVVSESDRTPLTSTYTNSNPSSLTSTVGRGRTIVDYRENQEAADQTTLDALAERVAFEASQVYESVNFETAIMPHHSDSDVYTLTFSALGISSKYSEVSWEFDLKAGAKMRHTIRKVVYV